jgi:hypothetical protein
MSASILEEEFEIHLKAYGFLYEKEKRLIPEENYKFDFYLPEFNVSCEIHGGTQQRPKKIGNSYWIKPTGHNTMTGIRRDCRKSNLAQINGIIALAFTGDMIKSGEAIDFLLRYREQHEESKQI